MPADTPLSSAPEAEQLVGSSSSEADDKDFNSEATESACSDSGGSAADSDGADAEAGAVAEKATPALPAQAAASADEYAGIWGTQQTAPHFVVCSPGAHLMLGTPALWEQTLRTLRTSTHQCWTLPTWRRRCALRLQHMLLWCSVRLQPKETSALRQGLRAAVRGGRRRRS